MAIENNANHGVVLFARDISRVADFYQQTLGLSVVEEKPSHYLLQGGGIEIVIHALSKKAAASIVIEDPPERRVDSPFKPAFFVQELSAVRAAAKSTGGGLKPVSGAWEIRGAVVLDGWDPEGNIVQFKQKI
ncbi:hypothetical protein AB833_05315 [Chromatiales bacterium (ex Bugula neritina AB1)]|nr:hypothetical protein AB833_05315 [Chromatiales bacterium (ex Bugula neritina AB1)]